MEKPMKKFLLITICLIFSLTCFIQLSYQNTHVSAAGEYEDYLISPTAIAVSDNNLFVFDEWENELILYDLSTKERMASVTLSGVSKLKISGDKLYALRNTSETEMSLSVFNFSLENQGTLNFQAGNQYIDFVISGLSLTALKANGDIHYFSISETTLNYQYTRESSAWEFPDLVSRHLIGMNHEGDNVTLIFTNGIYSYNTETSQSTKIYAVPNETTITHSTEQHIRLSDKTIVKIQSGEAVATINSNCSAIADNGNKIYLSNKDSHQVFVAEDGVSNDICLNPDIEPTMFTRENFKHIKLTAPAYLKLKPYSVNAKSTLNAGKHLTIIGESGNYYYCLVVGETNGLLFLEKATTLFEEIEIGFISTEYVVTVPTQIRSLPSTLTDNNNSLKDVHAGETVVVKNSTIIKNSKDELFYLVEIDGGFGFIKYSAVQSTRGNYELTTPCNAKTKRATTLFENADGTGEIIKLEKGTRIAMQEETAPTKDYVKIEYQDTNGIIYSGYVLADDIDPDGLSTLQILGLILVGTNLALLVTIIAIKRNSKKWKV